MTARSDLPIRREISWVRPPMRPLTDSRSERVLVADGSMAYSAVTQPSPEPVRQRGTPVDAEAAQHSRAAKLDQDRACRVILPVPGDLDVTELIGGAPIGAQICHEARLSSPPI